MPDEKIFRNINCVFRLNLFIIRNKIYSFVKIPKI